MAADADAKMAAAADAQITGVADAEIAAVADAEIALQIWRWSLVALAALRSVTACRCLVGLWLWRAHLAWWALVVLWR